MCSCTIHNAKARIATGFMIIVAQASRILILFPPLQAMNCMNKINDCFETRRIQHRGRSVCGRPGYRGGAQMGDADVATAIAK